MRRHKPTHEKRSFDTVATQFIPTEDMTNKAYVFFKRKLLLVNIKLCRTKMIPHYTKFVNICRRIR